MSRNTQYPTMPCYCTRNNKPESRYFQRSETSDTDEYDYLKHNFPRSDYSGGSSQRYENSSILDDQAWNTLSSLRQKACRFITSETEDTATDYMPLINQSEAGPHGPRCQCPRDNRYGGSDVLRRANDLIDYAPQSEFLKRIKQQCQYLENNEPNIFSALDEGLEPYNYQILQESATMDNYDDDVLYQNSAYDPQCTTDEKLLDQLIDRRLPNERRPKSANKKSEHVSRSKKPVKCRGIRKRKSGSSEKCESEEQFEPTLKRPHENSCERCWRYASPSRSPVNKPDQKYDPNFRRGHSCYDFEGGDGESLDRHVSPCKNLQPITSREKQDQPPVTSPVSKQKTPEVRSLSSDRQKSPDVRPQTASSGRQKSTDVRPQTASSGRQKPAGVQPQTATSGWQNPAGAQPQTSVSIWQKYPTAQPQTFTPDWQNCPEVPDVQPVTQQRPQVQKPVGAKPRSFSIWQKPADVQPQMASPGWQKSSGVQPLTFSSNFQKSPDQIQPQMPSPGWQNSSGVQPQTFSSNFQKSPDVQPQMASSGWQKYPTPQPHPFTPDWQKCPEVPDVQPVIQQRPQVQFRGQSPPVVNENNYNYSYPSNRSPERNVSRPQPLNYSSQANYPVSQSVPYSEPTQRPRPQSPVPDMYSLDIKRCSDGIDELDLTEYRNICAAPREEIYEPASSISVRPTTGINQQCAAGDNSYSPRHASPPRPCPPNLGTIPEVADSDSSKSKTLPKEQRSSPKSVRVKSPKSPARQRTPKTDSTGQSKRSPSPSKKSKSPNKSTGGSSPNKSSKSSNRSGNGSTKKCKPKTPSPKPGTSKQEPKKSPAEKSPQKSPRGGDAKKIKSLDNVKNTPPTTPQKKRPQSSPRVREVGFREDQSRSPVREESPDQYMGLDHAIRDCPCGPEDSFSRNVYPRDRIVCCHCNWEKHQANGSSPQPSRRTSPNKRPQSQHDSQPPGNNLQASLRGSPTPENKPQTYKGFDGRTFECPHRKAANLSALQPQNGTLGSSFERDCRMLSELQNTPSFQSTFQGMSRILPPPRTYFMFYMTKSKENKGDDDVEVLVEELTHPYPKKSDPRTKDITEKMKKIMECPSDSMALRFQKGVSDQCRIPQSSRVLYF